MQDLILLAVLLAVIALAVRYIVQSKKKGVTCIGCPHAQSCAAKAKGCGCSEERK